MHSAPAQLALVNDADELLRHDLGKKEGEGEGEEEGEGEGEEGSER